MPILGTTSFPTTTEVMKSREASIASSLGSKLKVIQSQDGQTKDVKYGKRKLSIADEARSQYIGSEQKVKSDDVSQKFYLKRPPGGEYE